MDLLLVSPVRLLGDGLAACLSERKGVRLQSTVADLRALRDALSFQHIEVVLIDVTQGIDLDEVRAAAAEHPTVALVALGLREQCQDVVSCGRAGFVGYLSRSSSIDELCNALPDIVAGRLACSSAISGGLLRALYRTMSDESESRVAESLTQREGEVLQLIGRGLSNKEIARELCLSLATIKHHVHNVLDKLGVSRRAQAMRRVRNTPWIASSPSVSRSSSFGGRAVSEPHQAAAAATTT
jgi:two-component system, NarL family, nitrate/nitrite response regulator NarL